MSWRFAEIDVADRAFRRSSLLAFPFRFLVGEVPLVGVALLPPSLTDLCTFLELNRVGTGNGGGSIPMMAGPKTLGGADEWTAVPLEIKAVRLMLTCFDEWTRLSCLKFDSAFCTTVLFGGLCRPISSRGISVFCTAVLFGGLSRPINSRGIFGGRLSSESLNFSMAAASPTSAA